MRSAFLVMAFAALMQHAAMNMVLTADASPDVSGEPANQVIVQIYGRMCEYHREDVEAALRAFSAIRQVEFLNDHGTVLAHYQLGHETPQQFAGAVERALTTGWNCVARVDRGEQKVVPLQHEGRP